MGEGGGPRWVPRPKGLATGLGSPEGEAKSHPLPPPALGLLGAKEGPGERTRSSGRGVSRSAPSSPLRLPGHSVCRWAREVLGYCPGAIVSCGTQRVRRVPGTSPARPDTDRPAPAGLTTPSRPLGLRDLQVGARSLPRPSPGGVRSPGPRQKVIWAEARSVGASGSRRSRDLGLCWCGGRRQ